MENKNKIISEIIESIRAKENPLPILVKFGFSSTADISPQSLNECSATVLKKLLSQLN